MVRHNGGGRRSGSLLVPTVHSHRTRASVVVAGSSANPYSLQYQYQQNNRRAGAVSYGDQRTALRRPSDVGAHMSPGTPDYYGGELTLVRAPENTAPHAPPRVRAGVQA